MNRPVSGLRVVALVLAGLGSAVAAATRPATTTGPATGPAAGGATVAGMSKAFLDGKIEELEAGMGSLKEASLTPAEKADVAYIRQAAGEARQGWWKQVKTGRTVNIRPVVWGRPLAATFEPTSKNAVETSWNGGRPAFTLNWGYTDMDAPEHAEHGFSKGELCEYGLWRIVGDADAWAMVPPSTFGNYKSEAGNQLLNRFLEFRANITGTHYAMPRARRWGLWLCCAAYMQKHAGEPTVNSSRAVAVVLMQEILSHAAKYPSLKIPSDLDPTEEAVALFLKDRIEKKAWTLAEDKMIREALKVHAGVNEASILKTGRVALANGLAVALDPEQDKPLREKRDAWIKAQLAKLPKDGSGD